MVLLVCTQVHGEEQYGYLHDAEDGVWQQRQGKQRVPPLTDGPTEPETGHANSLLYWST